ncbi:Putative oxidoreductase [Mycobacterium talmoniae]|uniref:Oxidoreductase n=1 Tax=Mycobacterium talmoniae TaxID=1858794 RepID=A0A2S8BP62_9MYCO|nr:Putative oxidoreductase [Mycobacterium talmoniae]
MAEARGLFPHHLDAIINVPAPRFDAGDPRTYTPAELAAAWRNTWDAGMLSAVLTVQTVGDHLRSGGSIISVVPENPRDGSADAAVKAALSNWTAGQATLFGTRGITVNVVAGGRDVEPGYTGLTSTPAAGGGRGRPAGAVFDHPGGAAHHRTNPARQPRGAHPVRLRYSRFAGSVIGDGGRPLATRVDPVTTRLGFQIPNFSYGTGVSELFPTVIAQAQEAEAAGFDSVFLMDHFYQLPMLGSPDQPMLEAYTALGALATATSTVQLGTLVTGNTYRNPTLLAKVITTLDVVSAGRAILGIGTGWFELEHDQLGFEFGTFTDRFNRLGEALQIILPMITGERPTFSGRWYRTEQAMAEPRYRDRIPLLIGGSGEKKTIPLAARHFDHLNIIAGFDELPGKIQAVRRSCEEIGRDPATLETSALITALVDDDATADQIPAEMSQRMVVGSADAVAEQIKTKVLDAGVGGVIINMPFATPGAITAAGAALRPLVDG